MEEKRERKSVRDELAEKFISILESDKPLEWVKGWSSSGLMLPYNGETGRKYNGVNRFILLFRAMEENWSDPRYYTFHQVNQMEGCHIRAGEKATGVEYWLVYDTKEKKSLTFKEYERLLKADPERKEDEFRIYAKTAYVFNAAQVEGLQLLVQPVKGVLEENQLADEVIKTMAENMEVKLVYGSDEAFYRPATDTIHLPRHEDFHSTGERISTTLHELAHSTSSPTRLNRPITGFREDPEKYAMEELRAEIASCFTSAEVDLAMSESMVENNRAYVQHWLSAIKEDHNALFAAIKDADKIADYMIEMGRVAELRTKLEAAAITPKTFDGATYEIWQLKDTPENDRIRFSEFAFASMYRLTESRYEKVYEAQAGSDDNTLDKIFVKYNINHPADYQAHSLSMSDVVVVNKDGKRSAWYCDSFDFKPVAGFSPAMKESRGIVSNVHYLYVLSSNNSNSLTSEVVCKMAGSYYEKTVSISEGGGTSTTTSFQEKQVLRPEDLNNLGEDAILIITNHGYIRTHKEASAYYRAKEFKSKYEKIMAVNREAMAGV